MARLRLGTGMLVLMMLLALTGQGHLQAGEAPVKIKIGTVAPDDTPWAGLLNDFTGGIKKEAGDKVAFEFGYGGVYGGERELLRLCREGKVGIIGVSTTIVAELIPELNVLEMPYLFNNNEEVDYIIDDVLDPIISNKLQEKGLVLVMWADNGFKNLATVRPVRSFSDVKGMAVRTQQSKIYNAMFTAFGMRTVPLSVNEVAQGLQSGVIQGFDNSALFTYASGLRHYIKYYTLTEHTYQPVLMLMSKKVLDRLPVDVRPSFWSRREALTASGRAAVRLAQQRSLQLLRNAGVQVIPLTMEQKATFINAAERVYKQSGTLLGPRGEQILKTVRSELKRLRKLK